MHLKEKFEEWRNGEPCTVYTSDPNIENLLREIEKVQCQLPNEYDSRRNLVYLLYIFIISINNLIKMNKELLQFFEFLMIQQIVLILQ